MALDSSKVGGASIIYRSLHCLEDSGATLDHDLPMIVHVGLLSAKLPSSSSPTRENKHGRQEKSRIQSHQEWDQSSQI